MSSQSDKKLLPKKFGKWTVIKQIASRPDSNVFLGSSGLEKAAIKVLKGVEFSDDTVQRRFHQEIFNLQSLNHPGVPKILEFDLTNALNPWMAIEYVQGDNLETLVKSKSVLKGNEWLKLLADVTQTLAYVHSNGIYHRDISPSNIIIQNNMPKLIDFGVSYIENSELVTMQGEGPLGTPATASPESFLSKKSAKMDMFSLASTFIFAGTGRFPFESDDDKKSNFQRISFEKPNFYDLSKSQINLLTPLLYKEPRDRISSHEFYEVVSQIQDFENLGSDSIPGLENHLKEAQRKLVVDVPDSGSVAKGYRKFVISSSVAVLLALVGFSIFSNQRASNRNLDSFEVTTQVQNPEAGESFPMSAETSLDAKDGTSTNSNKETTAKNSSQAVSDCYIAIESRSKNIRASCLKAAQTGDLKSIYFLGLDSYDESDYVEAQKWFLKAAKKGDYQSMSKLWKVYEKLGDDSSRDYWLKECANGYYGINGTSPKGAIAECKMFYAMDLREEGNESTAIKYAKDAVSYGQGSAAYWLAIIYRDKGDSKNYATYLKQAVNLGEDAAINELINFYDSSGQEESTLQLLDQLSKNGNQNANLLAAGKYFELKNYSKARQYGSLCASAGISQCNYIMGTIEEIEKNYIAAKGFFEIGYRQGSLDSGFRLGAILTSKDKELDRAEKIFLELAKKEHFPATSSLVSVYLEKVDLVSACDSAKKTTDLASKLKLSGKWKASFDKYLEANETLYKDLCKVN